MRLCTCEPGDFMISGKCYYIISDLQGNQEWDVNPAAIRQHHVSILDASRGFDFCSHHSFRVSPGTIKSSSSFLKMVLKTLSHFNLQSFSEEKCLALALTASREGKKPDRSTFLSAHPDWDLKQLIRGGTTRKSWKCVQFRQKGPEPIRFGFPELLLSTCCSVRESAATAAEDFL